MVTDSSCLFTGGIIFILQQIYFVIHKVDLVDMIAVIFMIVNRSKRISLIDISYNLNLNHKKIFILCESS